LTYNRTLLILGIKTKPQGIEYAIQRSLHGGGATLSSPGNPDRILGEKHQAGNDDTISNFFLSVCGLNGPIVRKNNQGVTRQISFRDVAHLIVVDEQEVIRKHSPVRSGETIHTTVEDSVFRLFLTGIDDGSVVALPKKSIIAAESKGKIEIIDLLIGQVRESLEKVNMGLDPIEIENRLKKIDADINTSLAIVNTEERGASRIEERRESVWKEVRQKESRLAVLSELQERFLLLKDQYVSDLRRLQAIAEAGVRLNQMDQIRCPVCGSEAKYHEHDYQDQSVAPDTIAQACAIEAEQLQLLLGDLDQTISHNAMELLSISEEVVLKKRNLQLAENELKSNYKPRLNIALAHLQEARSLQAQLRSAFNLHERLNALNTLRSQFGKTDKKIPKSTFISVAGASQTEELALKIEEVLRGWQFPGLQRVTFNEADQDILISGRRRSDHGKGVRAITHAAFTIGLMYYCIDKLMPHPGVVVIDSPLVVYREPDTDEAGFSRTLKDMVYSFLASQENRGQIILLENEDPPAELPDSPTIIRFTGAPHGRSGFIPPTKKANTEIKP